MVDCSMPCNNLSMAKVVNLSYTHKRIGTNIRTIRLSLNLTQEQLAEDVGITPSYLALIEQGKRNITIYTLGNIATALQVQLSDIVK